MRHTLGRMRGRTRVLGRKVRARKITVNDMVRKLEVGDRVQLVPVSKFEDFPAPRYSGRVATVTEKRGNAYVVELKDGLLTKRFVTQGVHLKKL